MQNITVHHNSATDATATTTLIDFLNFITQP